LDGGGEQSHQYFSGSPEIQQGSTGTKRLGIIAAVLLSLGYALPYHLPVHGVWFSLLLGPVGGGFTLPLQQRIFFPFQPIGVVAALLYVSIARRDRSMNLLGAGVMIGVGVAESLFFITLLGEALVLSLAIWIGLLGAVVALIGGFAAWRGRDIQP